MDFTTSALIASWVAIGLLALVVSGLIRQVHQLSRGTTRPAPRQVGIRPGTQAPEGADLLDGHRAALLLFLSPGCRTCTEVLEEAGRWAADRPAAGVALRAVFAGPAPDGTGTTGHAVPVREHRADLFDSYDAIATPFGVVIGEDGRVLRAEPLGSREDLPDLLTALPPVPGDAGTTPAPAPGPAARTRSAR